MQIVTVSFNGETTVLGLSANPLNTNPWSTESSVCSACCNVQHNSAVYLQYFMDFIWFSEHIYSSPATRHSGASGERMYSSYSLLTSALDGGEWSASRSSRSLPRGKDPPGTHCTGGWVGPRAGLDTEVRGKVLCLCRGSNLDRPVVQSVIRHYTDWATPAPWLSE
jgi:hypothetical protein